MELTSAKTLALTALKETGLIAKGWTFDWDRATSRFGLTSFNRKRITLSAPITKLNPSQEVIQVIIHEVAHALAGPGAGHGPAWRKICRELGGDATRTHQAETPPAKYHAICATCGHEHSVSRASKQMQSKACGKCCKKYNGGRFSAQYRLFFVPNPAYKG